MTDAVAELLGRVTEVWSSAMGGTTGTGYLIGTDLILTALHVLRRDEEPPAREIAVRPLLAAAEMGGLQDAELIWPPADRLDAEPLDAALLRLRNRRCRAAPKIDMGKPKNPPDCLNLPLMAVGFPAFAPKAGDRQDTEQISGIAPLASSIVAGKYQIAELQNTQKKQVDDSLDWRGMSGAPLLSEGRLIGLLVARKSANQRYDFSGIRIEKLLEDKDFRSFVEPCIDRDLEAPKFEQFTKALRKPRHRIPDPSPDDSWEHPSDEFSEILGKQFGSPNPTQKTKEMAPILARYWDRLDRKLQDAFALAATHVTRAGKTYISTTTLFAALHRLRNAPMPEMLDALPLGAMGAPSPAGIEPDYGCLQIITELSPCVTRSLENLAPKVGSDAVLSSEDMFVDIARFGTGGSTIRMRNHGVDEDWIKATVDALDWQVLSRDDAAVA
ncbi:MAG: trypsin-like peptidase domain-containing protein [Pseudomonadota bacterium]